MWKNVIVNVIGIYKWTFTDLYCWKYISRADKQKVVLPEGPRERAEPIHEGKLALPPGPSRWTNGRTKLTFFRLFWDTDLLFVNLRYWNDWKDAIRDFGMPLKIFVRIPPGTSKLEFRSCLSFWTVVSIRYCHKWPKWPKMV